MISYNGIINIFLFQYSTKKCFGLICVPHIYLIYSYIQRRLRGFIAITFVCPFVCVIVSSPVFIMQKIGSSYITKRLPMTRGCVIILTKLNWASSRSLGGKVQNSFLICIFFMEKNWIFFFTPRLFRPEGVSSFRPLSYGLVQCHWKET